MTAGTIEVTPLSELEDMLNGTPPCGAFVVQDYALCGNPAVVRLRVTCTACGAVTLLFLCRSCVGHLRAGKALCGPAGCGNYRFSWTET